MSHRFDVANAERLDDVGRYRFCSREELVELVGAGADRVVDLGSGTGFYTRDVAPHVGTCIGLDVQRAMHVRHRADVVPPNVPLVTADVDALPFAADSLDAAFTTMTFHEVCTPAGLAAIARVLRPGGRFVNVDWSAAGEGADGPPRAERQSAASAADLVSEAGFAIDRAEERPETFVLVALAP